MQHHVGGRDKLSLRNGNNSSRQIVVIDGWDIANEITLRRMALDLTDDKSTFVQVQYFETRLTHFPWDI